MSSRQHGSETFFSPRNPISKIRIFSSVDYCRRVWQPDVLQHFVRRRFARPESACLSLLSYDEPELFSL
jgi:hypothetical protein